MTLYEQALAYLDTLHIMPKTAPALDKMKGALSDLDLVFPNDLRKVIVVAGTNGKGTTSKTLETLLLAAGKNVSLFLSPHMVTIRERLTINGQPMSQELFGLSFQAIKSVALKHDLSHFETITLMAAWICFGSGTAVPKIEYFIFEVGMGGLWDATNAIPHKTCVITKLGLDHVPILGTTLAEIAAQKYGIIHEDCDVYAMPLNDMSVDPVRQKTISETGCRWTDAPHFTYLSENLGAVEPENKLLSIWGTARLSLHGHRAAENTNLALTVFKGLGFDPTKYLNSLSSVRWPGRMERLVHLESTTPIFYSGDHNVQGVESLISLLKNFRFKNIWLVFGIGKSKDADPMLDLLAELPHSKMCFFQSPFQGRSAEDYGHWITTDRPFYADVRSALSFVKSQSAPDDLILITGTLYAYSELF